MSETETTIYYDEDAELSVLDDRTVAFVGYGSQGRSQALNVRDSGIDVVVGNREDGYRDRIREDGFEPVSLAEAAERGDVVCLLVPDEVAPEVFQSHVLPNLDAGDTVYVSHGYNLTYDLLGQPEWIDVVMVAPRMGGPAVRTLYESGQGFPSILAVEQDHTGEAEATALAMAKAIGSTQAGVVEGTADMETITDLLTEQALFPIWANAMLAKFQVEVAHGVPPEMVMTELYLSHEMAEIFEEMARHGYLGQLPFHSPTSQYGQLSRMDEFDEGPLVDWFEEQLAHIDNGGFAREWSAEQSLDRPGLKRLLEKYEKSDFFQAEQRTMERLNLSAAAEELNEE
jgi:ketol-acid reductoisomerase